MEIRGEDFIKKVQLKQEKEEIEQRLNEIKDSESVYSNQNQDVPPQLDRELQIQEDQEYSDIMLGKNSSEEKNKKKYLILGLILIILFLLTIITIRLLTSDSQKKDNFSKSEENSTQKIVENDNIEEQYQKIINEKLKNIKEENEKEDTLSSNTTNEKLNLEKIEKNEKVVEPSVKKVVKTKPNVFEVKKPKPIVKPKPKLTVKKKVIKKAIKQNKTITTRKPKGTFVQIGAFSKVPTKKYLNDLSQKGFKYKIYKVSINKKMFHKILIGPYNSRKQAKLAIENIKSKLKISGAFILKF